MTSRGLRKSLARAGILISFCATSRYASAASAQEWLQDKRYAEGAGYQTGDFTLHPGVGIMFGYDSNYLLRSNQAGASNGCPNYCPEQSAGMNIVPSLSITTKEAPQRLEAQGTAPTPRTFNFSGGLSASYHEDFGTLNPEQRNVGLAQDARLEILPGRVVGGDVFETYARTIQPSVFGNPDIAFNRDDVGVGADFILTPGQGTLDWRLGYQFHDAIFEQGAAQSCDSITNQISLQGRWSSDREQRSFTMLRPRSGIIRTVAAASLPTFIVGTH